MFSTAGYNRTYMPPLDFSILIYFVIEHCRRFGYNDALFNTGEGTTNNEKVYDRRSD